jgi:hypothetical protein
MAYLKLIMGAFWIIVLGVSVSIFLRGIWEGNILAIRISICSIIVSVPTLIAIIKEVN